MQKPIRCVQFTKAVVRHANIRDQNPSFGKMCPSDPPQCVDAHDQQKGKEFRYRDDIKKSDDG